MDNRGYWIGFDQIRGIGSVRTKKLLDFFGDLSEAWKASPSALIEAGMPKKVVDSFVKIRGEIDLQFELERMAQLGINVLTYLDEDYPRSLQSIEYSPPVLYTKGHFVEEDEYSVAVVGTRLKTSYGKQVSSELARYLASNGITVVSGLARGIDTIAHQSSIDAGGRTIAVFGSGLDVIYPPENRDLAKKIESNGVLVSEFYPGTQPEAVNFPPRNRIISGLSKAVVIVEADEKSGALITARFAVEQARDVFAVPGSIYAPRSKGTNRLIRDGAIPLMDFSELLLALNMDQSSEFRYVQKMLPKNDLEMLLLNTIRDEPLHIDDIKSITGLSTDKVSASLVMMELKGFVRKVGNMTYQTVFENADEYEV
ncbi:MAG: DNA-processing protein DprA [Pelolinea sp.]|nr:DNA-processing protein DprA [Pelolinea sp.]